MKKILAIALSVVTLSACSTTYIDVAYNQQGDDCIYKEYAHDNKFFGRGDIIEKKISYENTKCSAVIASDLSNGINKNQSLNVMSYKALNAVSK